ncbi:MAG: PTS sugar transporter subunit IIC, partial [Collinsella aerofaciens]
KFFWTGALCFFLTRAVPVFIATGIGSFVIEDIMNFLQNQVPWVLSGFSTAGGMMPAVGLAMLLTMMMKKNMWIFLLLGFIMAAFLNVPTVGIALAACAAAGVWDVITEGQKNQPPPGAAIADGPRSRV